MISLRRRRKAKLGTSSDENEGDEQDVKQQKPKKRRVKAHAVGKNECRMTADNKVICPLVKRNLEFQEVAYLLSNSHVLSVILRLEL